MEELLTAPLTDLVCRHLGVERIRVRGLYAPPGKGFAGDLALPCFQLAAARRMSPPKLALEITALVENARIGVRAAAAGPFVNLSFEPAWAAALLLPAIADD